jgi:hypothetical protein
MVEIGGGTYLMSVRRRPNTASGCCAKTIGCGGVIVTLGLVIVRNAML